MNEERTIMDAPTLAKFLLYWTQVMPVTAADPVPHFLAETRHPFEIGNQLAKWQLNERKRPGVDRPAPPADPANYSSEL